MQNLLSKNAIDKLRRKAKKQSGQLKINLNDRLLLMLCKWPRPHRNGAHSPLESTTSPTSLRSLESAVS